MSCGGCRQARQQFVQSARRFGIRGAASAVARGFAINVDKMRNVDTEAKYGTGEQPTIKATPYKRPPERST